MASLWPVIILCLARYSSGFQLGATTHTSLRDRRSRTTSFGSSPKLPDALKLAPFEVRTAVEALCGLKSRTSEGPLDLLEDYYDPSTGLVSPGVWHNAMVGIAAIRASRELKDICLDSSTEFRDWAQQIGTSLYARNFVNGQGFHRRSKNTAWRSGRDPHVREQLISAGVNADYYEDSMLRRGASNAAASIFYSFLVEELPEDKRVGEMFGNVSKAFQMQFFNPSNGRFRERAVGDEDPVAGEPCWRAVDQAVGVLACLRMVRVDSKRNFAQRTMAAAAAEELLDSFGYGKCAEGEGSAWIKQQLPSQSQRNSWSDAVVCLAIFYGEACSGRESSAVLARSMERDYARGYPSREPGEQLMCHLPQMSDEKAAQDARFYVSTQAIWAAALRGIDGRSQFVGSLAQDLEAMWNEKAVGAVGQRLMPFSSEANSPVRLWANTELAAFLLLDPGDFRI